MKNQKGVTLIALVITIIVLIILAAVSIAMLTGENGILTEAESARTKTNDSTIADKINMELNAFKADILADGKITYDSFSKAKASLGSDYKIKAGETVLSTDSTITDQTTLDNQIGAEATVTIENSTGSASISGSIELKTDEGSSTIAGRIRKASNDPQ